MLKVFYFQILTTQNDGRGEVRNRDGQQLGGQRLGGGGLHHRLHGGQCLLRPLLCHLLSLSFVI